MHLHYYKATYVGIVMLHYLKFVIHCTYYSYSIAMHLLIIVHYYIDCTYSSCDGNPLIPSSFHSFWWIPTLLHVFKNVFTLVCMLFKLLFIIINLLLKL